MIGIQLEADFVHDVSEALVQHPTESYCSDSVSYCYINLRLRLGTTKVHMTFPEF